MAIDIVRGTGYRIGTSARTLGGATATPEDFIVLNTTNNKLYKVDGGVWTDAGNFPNGEFSQELFDEWLAS